MSLLVTPVLRKAPEAGQGPPGILSPLGVQGRIRAGSEGGRGCLQGNRGPAAPAGRPSSVNGDTRLLTARTENTDRPPQPWWGRGAGGEDEEDGYSGHWTAEGVADAGSRGGHSGQGTVR